MSSRIGDPAWTETARRRPTTSPMLDGGAPAAGRLIATASRVTMVPASMARVATMLERHALAPQSVSAVLFKEIIVQ